MRYYTPVVVDDRLLEVLARERPATHGNHGIVALLNACLVVTHCGTMIIIADTVAIHLLQCIDSTNLTHSINRLTNAVINPGCTDPMVALCAELEDYFGGTLQCFRTPMALRGTSFQQSVWHAANQISFGQTASYASVARSLGNPKAARAVGSANAVNPIVLLIACHRVIGSDGGLGGYNGGINHKQWLINFERQHYLQ
jgi:AraC family transcriptional regulator, regulatory protein of adaptative response / methylated-DNA-[protein]-cysteine methyltransferase